jgi:hypothetical protein
MQTNDELESNCILFISEKDYFEQKYDFMTNEDELYKYSGFHCKIESRVSQIKDEYEEYPVKEFVSNDWDFFKLRVFSLLFASQSLVYDVIDIMKDELSVESITEQQRHLYFYSFMGIKMRFY